MHSKINKVSILIVCLQYVSQGPNILKQFIHLILRITQIRKPRSGVAQHLSVDHTVHKCQNQTSCPNEEDPTPTSLLNPRLIYPSSFFVFTRNLKLHMLDLLFSPVSYQNWTSIYIFFVLSKDQCIFFSCTLNV